MKPTLIRKLIGGVSLTSALFMFQACYGTPQDANMDILIEGQVKSATSGSPINGIKVSTSDGVQYQFCGTDGKFSFYTGKYDNKKLIFEDIDSTDNGSYQTKDTVISAINDYIYLDIELQEK